MNREGLFLWAMWRCSATWLLPQVVAPSLMWRVTKSHDSQSGFMSGNKCIENTRCCRLGSIRCRRSVDVSVPFQDMKEFLSGSSKVRNCTVISSQAHDNEMCCIIKTVESLFTCIWPFDEMLYTDWTMFSWIHTGSAWFTDKMALLLPPVLVALVFITAEVTLCTGNTA